MTEDELEQAFVELFAGEKHDADRILRTLRGQFSDLPREDVIDMFNDACADVVARQCDGRDTRNIAGLITTMSRNKLQDMRKARYAAEEQAEVLELRAREGWRHDEDHQSKVERGAKYVRDLVAGWDSENHRRTMTLLIDAAVEGVLLTPKEIDERLGCARGTGGVWKQRSLDRLRVDLDREGIATWDDLMEAIPLTDEEQDEEEELNE